MSSAGRAFWNNRRFWRRNAGTPDPAYSAGLQEESKIRQFAEVKTEELLHREPVQVDMAGISRQVRGKVVMVTGGGGSIGSELCRQLAACFQQTLIIFDIYENNAYLLQQQLQRQYPQLQVPVLIGSVRDVRRINDVMRRWKPKLIYHAAAHKHVPLMEDSPLEAVKNNIFGTWNTAVAAAENQAEHFVLISSDKAVNPTNVMGATKRICEMIVQTLSARYDTVFAAVRFGNVLGSNGSVVPLFREQIRAGGPVQVTHPEIDRFYMTVSEAAMLVLQAGAYASRGEIFILDMGKPMKTLELARKMIRLAGFVPDEEIPIVFTGLRPGEKLYEELLLAEEGLFQTENRLIYVTEKTDFDTETFENTLQNLRSLKEGQEERLKELILRLVPSYISTLGADIERRRQG